MYNMVVAGNDTVEPLLNKVKSVYSKLNAIGEPEDLKDNSLILFHYSEDESIVEFSDRSDHNWTSVLTNDPTNIEHSIGKTSYGYKAIYIVKCNVGTRFRVDLKEPGGLMRESLIPCDIHSDYFDKIKVFYNKKTGLYEIKN